MKEKSEQEQRAAERQVELISDALNGLTVGPFG